MHIHNTQYQLALYTGTPSTPRPVADAPFANSDLQPSRPIYDCGMPSPPLLEPYHDLVERQDDINNVESKGTKNIQRNSTTVPGPDAANGSDDVQVRKRRGRPPGSKNKKKIIE
jgi:hypothetical protein